jgi:hypothetical protein
MSAAPIERQAIVFFDPNGDFDPKGGARCSSLAHKDFTLTGQPMRLRFMFPAAAIIWALQFAAQPALAYEACLGAKVPACLDAIRPYLDAPSYARARAEIDKYLAGDIAGKVKAKSLLSVPYHRKFADPLDPPTLLVFEYSPTLQSSQIQMSLGRGAGSAETEAEYQATHLYEAAIFALGTRDDCQELSSPHNFYLFFHTKVKPRLKPSKTDHIEGAFKPPSEFAAETGWIRLCGKAMNYSVSSAEWGAVGEDMTRRYNANSAFLAFR